MAVVDNERQSASSRQSNNLGAGEPRLTLSARLDPLRQRLVRMLSRAWTVLAPYWGRARALFSPWIMRARLFWMSLSVRNRWIASGAMFALVLLIAFTSYQAATGCSSHADVEARVADVTADLQAQASRGEISLVTLANRIKRINEAAKIYERDADAQPYCDALRSLRADGIE